MAATVFFEGTAEIATLTNTFKVSGVNTDPTTVSLTVTTPARVSTTYTYAGGTITKTGTGVYAKDIPCSEDGEWEYVWTGTTAASDVEAGTWTVFETDLGKLYGTVAALKSRLGISATDTADDYEIHAAAFSASRWVEAYCERVFYRSTTGTVRTFQACNRYLVRLPEYNDIVSVSALATDDGGDGTFETTWASTDYQLRPVNPTAAPEQRPYTEIKAIGANTFPVTSSVLARDDRVQVTGVFGWPSVPWAIRQACLIVAAETFKAKDTWSGMGGFGEQVPLRRNPQALDFARPYRRFPVKVA